MIDNLAITKILTDFSEMNNLGLPADKLVERFSDEVTMLFGIDKADVKMLGQKKDNTLKVEELVATMNKPYVDNKLSDYSEFPDLIVFFRNGYKSCSITPINVGGRVICVLTALSKKENKFNDDVQNALAISTMLFGYQISSAMNREKNTNLAKYFDASFDSQAPQCLIDKEGTIVKVNKALFIALAMNNKDLLGRKIGDIFIIDQTTQKSLDIGLFADVPFISNPRKTFKISQQIINGNLSHLLLYDNTYTKQLEERMKALDYSKFETLLMLSKDTTIVWASGNSGIVLKTEKENLIGLRLVDIIVDNKHFGDVIAGVEKEPYYGSATIDIANGIVLYTHILIFKNSTGYSCLVYNNNQENYLNSVRDNLDRLVDLTSDMIIVVSEFGYIKNINRKAEMMLGYSNSSISGKALSLFYSDQESQDNVNKGLGIARENGIANNIKANMLVKDMKDPLPCECSVERVIDPDGNLSGYIVLAKELGTTTERDVLRQKMEKEESDIMKLKSESDMKTQFIYNISHDLKTPITNIKGFATLLFRGDFGNVTDEQRSYLKIIIDESERFTGLVQQILDIAKLSAGKIKLDVQDVDFVMMRNNPSIEALAKSCEGKGLTFEWKVDDDVSTLRADPNRLIQVFVNLIGNAIKFTQTGGISIHVYKKSKRIYVDVMDTGIGIEKDDQKKLFKEFYQVERKGLTMQEGSGTGLGLSIVKKIMNLHGGDVRVKSELGNGTTFTFYIPLEGKKKKVTRTKPTSIPQSAESEPA